MALTDVKSEQIQSSVALAGSPTTTTQSASDNSTKIATTAYVETAVANLVASAPAALNTLDELAAALNDDASFSTTVTNSIATIMITAPCINTWWGINVQCPRQLTAISAGPQNPLGTAFATVCGQTINSSIYHVPVDNSGNSNPNSAYYDATTAPNGFPDEYDPADPAKIGQPNGVLGLHDWVFSDPNGETPLPIGMYKVQFDPTGGSTPLNYVIEVGFLEYRDVDGAGHALPPEGYPGPTQSTGTRQPGIVRSITLCP